MVHLLAGFAVFNHRDGRCVHEVRWRNLATFGEDQVSIGLSGARHAALRRLGHMPTRIVVLNDGHPLVLVAAILGEPHRLSLVKTRGESNAAQHLFGDLLGSLHVLAVGRLQTVC